MKDLIDNGSWDLQRLNDVFVQWEREAITDIVLPLHPCKGGWTWFKE